MRLIDADKLRIKCHTVNDLQPDKFVVSRMMVSSEVIDTEPTVDAIPIEWIKDYIIPFQVHHDSLSEELKENDGAGWVVDVLEGMLKKWEKENE